MTPFLAIVGALFGLAIGSFLNVVVHRIPAGKSVVHPPSACPHCGSAIRPRDNLPVVSWLALRGACRDCGARISPRYPIVEAATAVLFALTALIVGPRWVVVGYWWFVAVTVALTLTDIDHKRIPNRILFPGTVVGVVLLAVGAFLDGDAGQLVPALIGGVAYFVVMLLIALIAKGGFGFGDVKLAFLLGVFMGYVALGAVGFGFFLAFFLGGVASIALLALRIKGRKDRIPFGPYLVIGSYLAIAFGEPFLDWYLG